MRRRDHTRRGAAAIEFAMIAPIFFVLIVAVIELARVSYTQAALQFALEDAARVWVADPNLEPDEIRAQIRRNALLPGAGPGGDAITFDRCATVTESGMVLGVIQARFRFEWLIPVNLVGGNLQAVDLTARVRIPLRKNM